MLASFKRDINRDYLLGRKVTVTCYTPIYQESSAISPNKFYPEPITNSFWPIKIVFFREIREGELFKLGKVHRKYTLVKFSLYIVSG